MQRDIRPDWLLRLADELGYRGAPAGQPRNTNLRKAVSAAYYALFHALALATVQHLLPGSSDQDRYRLTRFLQHNALNAVCQWVSSKGNPPARASELVERCRSSVEVADIGAALAELREARFEADYDHLADFTKARVLNLVDVSRDAVQKVNTLQGSTEFQAFVALVSLKTSM